MAKLSLDPMLVAKINALLASFGSHESDVTLSDEDIIELFESLIRERPSSGEVRRRSSDYGASSVKLNS